MLSRQPLPLYAALLSSITLTLSVSASGSTGRQYVSLRQKTHCNRKLTYAAIQNNPANYIGHVFEVRGVVAGTIEAGKSISIVLNVDENTALTLDVPSQEATPVRETLSPHIHALLQVTDGGSGNVVPLKVIAIATDSEVEAIERQEQAKQAVYTQQEERERQAKARWHEAVVRSDPHNSGSSLPARGGVQRTPQPLAGDVFAQAALYQPALAPRVRDCFVPYFRFISRHNPSLSSKTTGQITFNLLRFAEANDVDPRLVVAMIVAESDFDPMSTSHAGAMGLGQLMPDEVKDLGLNNAYDVEQNLYGSIRNLRERLNDFSDRAGAGGAMTFEQIRLALAAYNAGVGAVKKYHGIPPYRETQGYVRRIEKLYRELCGQQ